VCHRRGPGTGRKIVEVEERVNTAVVNRVFA
jgi:hypothetical protein